MKAASLNRLESLEHAIVVMVMSGRAELAREFAADYALERDTRLTFDESTARWEA